MSNARTNDAYEARINKRRIFASGTFKNVYTGFYLDGARAGQRCVAKEFRTGSVYEDRYFAGEMRLIDRTQHIIDDFDYAGVIGPHRHIVLNHPDIWECSEGSGERVLIEPMIENFEKFNSNSGWTPAGGSEWSDAMQALSHFSYHNSNRQLLLCDLQGGVYRNGYVLTDPVIMSQTQTYGPADLGADGIDAFFQRHRCGRFCSRHWVRPAVTGSPVVPLRQGTTMAPYLPTRRTRDTLSRVRD